MNHEYTKLSQLTKMSTRPLLLWFSSITESVGAGGVMVVPRLGGAPLCADTQIVFRTTLGLIRTV